MGQNYLIDTNIIIDYVGGKIEGKSKDFVCQILNHSFSISVITQIELLSLPESDAVFGLLIDNAKIFGLSPEIVGKTIEIRRKRKIKIPDAIIAATSIIETRIILTNNTSDFDNIKNLKLINPYLIKE